MGIYGFTPAEDAPTEVREGGRHRVARHHGHQHPRRPRHRRRAAGDERGDALKRYGLLTIGDGLVSQIPALVLSTAAGVLVTRTASEEPDTPLGAELARQLFGFPKALEGAAGFVLLLAVVPGLPPVPFLVLSLLLFFRRARADNSSIATAVARTDPRPASNARGVPEAARSCPWCSRGASSSRPIRSPSWRTRRGPRRRPRAGHPRARRRSARRALPRARRGASAPSAPRAAALPSRHAVALAPRDSRATLMVLPDESKRRGRRLHRGRAARSAARRGPRTSWGSPRPQRMLDDARGRSPGDRAQRHPEARLPRPAASTSFAASSRRA